MSAQKLLYVFSRAPYSNAHGQEGIDAALIGAAFEQQISLLFLHDGVFQIKAEQAVLHSQLKNNSKTFGALADHDINQIYVHDNSLHARGLDQQQLSINVQVLDAEQISQLIAEQYRVFLF